MRLFRLARFCKTKSEQGPQTDFNHTVCKDLLQAAMHIEL